MRFFTILLLISFTYIQTFGQCNTNTSICTPGTAGPFNFIDTDITPSSCLDYWNGSGAGSPNYGFILLYITGSGPLEMLINGDNTTGFVDVSVFNIPPGEDPCTAVLDINNEISCNYANASSGCNQFGNAFPCAASLASPNVTAGDVLMIIIEDWSNSQNNYTMQLSGNPGAATTGPPDPTINPVGVTNTNTPPFNMTAATGGGTWSATCGPCIDPVTGEFDPSVSGPGTFDITYNIGSAPCDATDTYTITVDPVCLITNANFNISACDPATGTYTIDADVTFTDPPPGGNLIIENCLGEQAIYPPPFVSPMNLQLISNNPDGAACDVEVYFSDIPLCNSQVNYNAPVCPCGVTFLDVNVSACDPATDQFNITGSVEFITPPAAGQLIVEDCNGNQAVFNPPFNSPQVFAINNIPSDGTLGCDVEAYFTADPACNLIVGPYDNPTSCTCPADAGTVTIATNGDGINDYILCYNDDVTITGNGDYVDPLDVGPIGGATYDPALGFLVFSCPPTPGIEPNADPCFLGYFPGVQDIFFDVNDNFYVDNLPGIIDNTLYIVPFTFYDFPNGFYNVDCYDLGNTVAVQYLTEITSNSTENCSAGSATFTINGGYPEFYPGTNYTASNLLPATASFVNTTAGHGGTITIDGLQDGDMYSFDITDDNGCPHTLSGGPFVGPEDATFALTDFCFGSPNQATGIATAGGTFTFNPAPGDGATINAATGEVSNETAGATYFIEYTTPGNAPSCAASSIEQVSITGVDDASFTLTDYCFGGVNQATNIATPGGNFAFNPAPGDGATINAATGSISNGVAGTMYSVEYTTPAGPCQSTSIENVTVNPLDDASFTLTDFCEGEANNASAIATPGGTFSFNPNPGGGITINPATGEITGGIAGSNYTVQYQTNAACPNSSTEMVSVTNFDDATFNYDMPSYCQTGPNPVLNNTGTPGGTYSSTPAGLSINTATGAIDLATSALGNYVITYTTNGTCPVSSDVNLEVTDSPNADFMYGTYCANEVDPLPTSINGGTLGTFTSTPGISITAANGSVDLSASTPGTYTVTNTVNIAGCAVADFDADITINELPTATISGGGTVCDNDPLPNVTIDLTGNGPWNVDVLNDGVIESYVIAATPFNLPAPDAGDYSLSSVSDVNCTGTSLNGNVNITLNSTPTIQQVADISGCEGSQLVVPAFVVNPAVAPDWNSINTDPGTGMAGNGNIGAFTAQNGTVATITSTIEVTASNNGCVSDPMTFDITVYPTPSVDLVGDNLSGCPPLTVNFTGIGNGPNGTWSFSDGGDAIGMNASHTFTSIGCHDATFTMVDANGCTNSVTYTDYVCVTAPPVASFGYSPSTEITISNTSVSFLNNSLNATSYNWDFGDGNTSTDENPNNTYPDEDAGVYTVELIAHNSGCSDTAYAVVTVVDELIFYVPNTFTPDNDDYNESFKPIFTAGFDPFNYELLIFNRWGEILFESHDAEVGWDGTYGGELAKDGTYIWKITFKETDVDKRIVKVGHVNILK